LNPFRLDESRLALALAGQERIESACFRLGSTASLAVLRQAYVAACLEMTNRRSGSGGAVESMALAAGRNTKSTAKAKAETALVLTPVSAGPWRT
jgi:hypothetical protein